MLLFMVGARGFHRADMEVRVFSIGKTSITRGYRVYLVGDREEIVVEGHNVTVCVQNDTFEKIKVPEWLRRALKDYMDTFDN